MAVNLDKEHRVNNYWDRQMIEIMNEFNWDVESMAGEILSLREQAEKDANTINKMQEEKESNS